MGYVTYSDLCDRHTKKNIDDALAPYPAGFDETQIQAERERLIGVFSAEAESYGAKALHPFKDFTDEFEKVGNERDAYIVSVFVDYVAGKVFNRKAGSNQNTLINENLKKALETFKEMYKGNLPIPTIPVTEEYEQENVNTFITNAFFEKPKY